MSLICVVRNERGTVALPSTIPSRRVKLTPLVNTVTALTGNGDGGVTSFVDDAPCRIDAKTTRGMWEMIMAGFSIHRQWWRAAHQLYRCRPRERDLYFKIAIYKLVLTFLLRMDFWHVSCTPRRCVSETPVSTQLTTSSRQKQRAKSVCLQPGRPQLTSPSTFLHPRGPMSPLATTELSQSTPTVSADSFAYSCTQTLRRTSTSTRMPLSPARVLHPPELETPLHLVTVLTAGSTTQRTKSLCST